LREALMRRTVVNVTDAEWAVLEQLWEMGPATVRRLADVLYPRGAASEYATVHKLLERLEAKGHVRRERGGGAQIFRAALGRDEMIGRQVEALVDKMCGGSLQPLLTNLVRVRRLTPAELRDLRALVEELEAKARPRK
jgi:predicted transcriptional regulator